MDSPRAFQAGFEAKPDAARHRVRGGWLFALGLAVALAVAAAPAHADAKDEAAAKALQRKAMDEDYLGMDFTKAASKLEQAIQQCAGDKCSAQLRSLLQRDLGIILIGGKVDKTKGLASLVEAAKADPNVQLDPDLKNPEFEAALEQAKRIASGAEPMPTATPAGTPGQPAGDFTHTPVKEQQVRTAIPIYVEYTGAEQLVKVIARYRGFGMTEWKPIEFKRIGDKGWGGLVPCADVQQGTTQYYLQGFNAENDPVATGGDRNNPYKVPVKREKVASPPSLPGEQPPTQCADTGDCPPNFPGCKKGAVDGKEGGAFCEEDSECASNVCTDNKCKDVEGPKKGPRFWVGAFGAFEFTFVPSANDVCKLKPTNAADSQFPVNDKNYYCVDSSGTDYPYRLVGSNDQNPRRGENDALVTGGNTDNIDGGTAFSNIRVLLSIDYAATMNLLVGARLGYVLNTYPGQAASQDGRSFPPIHGELRGTYVFGKDPLSKAGFAPYAFFGAGVSTFESQVKVTVAESQAQGTAPTRRTVNAWQLAGPLFVSLGGGARYAITPRVALLLGLRGNLAFGNAFAPSIGPEAGVNLGF